MIEEELIQIWQSSSNQERIKFEKSKLMLEMKSSLDRFHKTIKNRNLRELLAALIVIPVFVYYVYAIPFILSKTASILIILFAIYVNIKLRSLNKHKPNTLTDSYIDYLYQCKKYLSLQKKMLETAFYWSFLPVFTFAFLFVLGFVLGANIDLKELTLRLIITSVIIIGCGIFIYFYNKRYLKKHYIPRLKKMEELIQAMEA